MQRINISQEVVFTEALTISTSRATSPGVFLSDTGSGLIPTPVTSIAKMEFPLNYSLSLPYFYISLSQRKCRMNERKWEL